MFASHALDLQTFPIASPGAASTSASDAYAFTYLAPVGPPSVNVEAKLTGVDDSAVEAGSDPVGALHVRGPSVGRPLSVEVEPEEEELGRHQDRDEDDHEHDDELDADERTRLRSHFEERRTLERRSSGNSPRGTPAPRRS